MRFFEASSDPAEGLGVLMLFRLVEEAVPAFFRSDRGLVVARAPGRLDVLGGLVRDPGAVALQLPIAEAACVAVQARDDDLVRLWSPGRDGSRTQLLSMRLQELGLPDAPSDYADARALFGADPRDRWAGHLLGGLLVLAREHGLRPQHGLELLLHSDVPERCGVAASTAITVASLRAVALLYGVELGARELAAATARIERDVVGGAHRGRDAMGVASFAAGELLAVTAGDVEARLAVPSDLEFVALDSGVPTAPGDVDDVAGAPGAAAAIERFRALLAQAPTPASRRELGDVLFAAHDAYRQAGRGEPVTDFLVQQARERRHGGGAVLGAKATGRGGGGTVLLLGEHGKVWYEALRIKKALLQHTGHSGHVFRWSSPGALAFGSIELRPAAAGGDG